MLKIALVLLPLLVACEDMSLQAPSVAEAEPETKITAAAPEDIAAEPENVGLELQSDSPVAQLASWISPLAPATFGDEDSQLETLPQMVFLQN